MQCPPQWCWPRGHGVGPPTHLLRQFVTAVLVGGAAVPATTAILPVLVGGHAVASTVALAVVAGVAQLTGAAQQSRVGMGAGGGEREGGKGGGCQMRGWPRNKSPITGIMLRLL